MAQHTMDSDRHKTCWKELQAIESKSITITQRVDRKFQGAQVGFYNVHIAKPELDFRMFQRV